MSAANSVGLEAPCYDGARSTRPLMHIACKCNRPRRGRLRGRLNSNVRVTPPPAGRPRVAGREWRGGGAPRGDAGGRGLRFPAGLAGGSPPGSGGGWKTVRGGGRERRRRLL